MNRGPEIVQMMFEKQKDEFSHNLDAKSRSTLFVTRTDSVPIIRETLSSSMVKSQSVDVFK